MNVVHSVGIKKGSSPQAANDMLVFAQQYDVANGAGGSAGASVTVAVAFQDLPAHYAVHVTPNQDATAYVANKTSTGFNVVLSPRLAANTLAAGTFDVTVTA